jgi:hypothetical protein
MLPMPLLKAFLSKLVHKDKQGNSASLAQTRRYQTFYQENKH